MEDELYNRLSNIVNISNIDQDYILYNYYSHKERKNVNEKIYLNFKNLFKNWEIIYDHILSRINELGILNRINSNLDININDIDLLIEKIREILNYLDSINHRADNNLFIIINSELYDIIIEKVIIIDDIIIDDNLDNKILFGVKNSKNEEGINIYFNSDDKYYSIVELGQDIENNYFTIDNINI